VRIDVFIATAILTQRGLSFKRRCTYEIMLACAGRRFTTSIMRFHAVRRAAGTKQGESRRSAIPSSCARL